MIREPLSTRERYYRTYRKIRFLLKRGSLFSTPDLSPFDYKDKSIIPKGAFTIITINSVFLFLLAYLLMFIITQFATAISASAFNIPAIIYYNEIDFLQRGQDWTSDQVIAVFSTGPLISLLIGVLLVALYIHVADDPGLLRLLVIWMILFASINFFGELLVGAILNQGFGYVIMYMFIMDTGKIILTLFGFVALFSLGLLFSRLFMFSGNIYFNDLHRYNRRKFIYCQFLFPYLIGTAVIFLIKLPVINPFELSLLGSMILILIPISIKGFTVQDLYFDEEPRKIRISVYFVLATILLLIAFRIVFGIGIKI